MHDYNICYVMNNCHYQRANNVFSEKDNICDLSSLYISITYIYIYIYIYIFNYCNEIEGYFVLLFSSSLNFVLVIS